MSTQIDESPDWHNKITPKLAQLAWPIVASMVSHSFMTLMDTWFVGQLGPAQLAGVGLGGMVTFTLLCFPIGLLKGIKVLVANKVGAGLGKQAVLDGAAGLRVALFLGIATVLIGHICAPLIGTLADSLIAQTAATHYTLIRLLGAPAFLVYVALREVRYGHGDTRVPMVAAILGNIVNIVLDYVFMVLLDYGVEGVAAASVAGNFVEAAILMRGGWLCRLWRATPRRSHFVALLRVGTPCGIQFLFEIGSFSVLTAIIATMSDVELAAHQIVLQVVHVSFLPAYAVAEASAVLVGYANAVERLDLVRRIAGRSLLISSVYTGACTVVLAIAGTEIIELFSSDAQLIATGMGLCYVAIVFLVADGANVVARCVLQGMGDVRYPAYIGVITAWICTPPMAWLLGHAVGLGAMGGWIGLCLQIILGAVLFWTRLFATCREKTSTLPLPSPVLES